MFVIFPHQDALTSFTTPVSEWSSYTFINVPASNYAKPQPIMLNFLPIML